MLEMWLFNFNDRNKRLHNFFKNYGTESQNRAEQKPLSYTDLGYIQIYEIKLFEHQNDYNFYDSEELIDEFIKNVRGWFHRQPKNVIIKCGFSIQNILPSLSLNLGIISDTRYLLTKPYQSKNFNDFV